MGLKAMKKNIIGQVYSSILVNAIYAMKNYPITLISTLLAPLSIMIVITLVSNGALLGVAILGALIASMVTAGTSLQGDLSHLKNDFRMQDMVVSSPTTAFVYLFGMAISEIVYALPALIALSILAVLFVPTSAVGAITIIVVLALIFSFSVALGFLLSTFSSDIMQNWAFAGIMSTLLTTIPPIYYPITLIPLPFRYIAYLSPTTYAAEIVQNAIGALQLTPSALVLDWIVLIVISSIIFIIAIKKNRWREI